MNIKYKVDFLLAQISEEVDQMLSTEGFGFEQLSAEELVTVAMDTIVNKTIDYQSVSGVINKEEAFFEMTDGTFQPLFSMPEDSYEEG